MKVPGIQQTGICFLNPGNYVGGAEKVIFQFMKHLDRNEFRIFAAGPGGELMETHLKNLGISLFPVDFDRFRGLKRPMQLPGSIVQFFKLVLILMKFCRQNHIGILYANEIKVAFIAKLNREFIKAQMP